MIADGQISVFVNNAEEPSLVVEELTERTGGAVVLSASGYGIIANPLC
ncbi:MAG: hypothetical protein N2D54_13250 [Chloroflexota bacterium]